MTNVLYDFTLGYPITPHFGFGVGAVDVFDGLKVPGHRTAVQQQQLAIRLSGYCRHPLQPQPDLHPRSRLPLLRHDPADTQASRTPICAIAPAIDTNNFVASLIYRFAPPPPPAPIPVEAPAPAPPAPQVFLVFFDWDRADVTPAGMEVVRLAANAYKAGGSVRLQVTGYTDLSGSAGYNQRLSERRANNVANALANLGVARSDMAVSRPRRERPARADPARRARAAEPPCRDRLFVAAADGSARAAVRTAEDGPDGRATHDPQRRSRLCREVEVASQLRRPTIT